MTALTPTTASHYKPPLQWDGLAMPDRPVLAGPVLADYAAVRPTTSEFPL